MLKRMKPFLFLGALMLGTLAAHSAPALAATFTVTKTDDTNDGTCDADCSLREAITAANATNANDDIVFDATAFAAPRKASRWVAPN